MGKNVQGVLLLELFHWLSLHGFCSLLNLAQKRCFTTTGGPLSQQIPRHSQTLFRRISISILHSLTQLYLLPQSSPLAQCSTALHVPSGPSFVASHSGQRTCGGGGYDMWLNLYLFFLSAAAGLDIGSSTWEAGTLPLNFPPLSYPPLNNAW